MARAFRNASTKAARGLFLPLLAVLMFSCGNDVGKPNRVQRMLLEPARDAEERGDNVAAFRNYLSAAKDGVVFAQYKVAGFYEQGRGTAKDDVEAARWYQEAGDGGDARAKRNLARMYETGRGVPQDDVRALALYREAAAAGEASAHFKVGQLTEAGRGTAADPMAAVEHYRAAAQAGQVDAQLALARLLRTDDDVVPGDPAGSERWYGEALQHLEADARRGDALAAERLADLYLEGRGGPKNVDRALVLYEAAANSGRLGAQVKLARVLHKGADGVPADPAKAARYLQMAADQGHSGAGYTLAQMYADGEGVPQDGARAVALYEESIEHGDMRAYLQVGDLYAKGDAVPQDREEAVRWYTLAAEHGDPRGLYRLGEAYERGHGVPEDLVQSLMWYSLALQSDYEPAKARVERVADKLGPADTDRAAEMAEAWQQNQG
jgi:TPR repeat protein